MIALIVIGLQMLSRPPANLLSLRATRYEMLDGLWPRSSSILHYPSWSTPPIEPDTELVDVVARCGGAADLAQVAERAGASTIALREMAQSMYRTDIIYAIADAVPWWRIKLWQLRYASGLWTHRLDEPSGYLPQSLIDEARASSDRWYRRVTDDVVCGATRNAKADPSRKG
ncbi:hypothetical protein [Sphingomonas jatrophae]|uniref:hypothetical protein n=1 Tax=Sphingomonas jatrophae TaxID=1166337 RepID=UPI00104264F4|nr:hypothetical protein [Sphingomonas jatrophae]